MGTYTDHIPGDKQLLREYFKSKRGITNNIVKHPFKKKDLPYVEQIKKMLKLRK